MMRRYNANTLLKFTLLYLIDGRNLGEFQLPVSRNSTVSYKHSCQKWQSLESLFFLALRCSGGSRAF